MRLEFKPIEEIKGFVKGNKVFVFSCDNCGFAKVEEKNQQVLDYISALGYKLVGMYTLKKEECNVGSFLKIVKDLKGVNEAEAILTFTCGGLPQIIPNYVKKQVFPATNTLKIEPGRSLGSFARLCSACGECWIYYTGNLCMEKLCPKKMRNGPCGGSEEGMCEVFNRLCPWVILFKNKRITEEEFLKIIPPKDFSKVLFQE
ncbi:MAG: methylenetetrahydrofolate reductase C-terminal domain-containing protein [Dictyoglomus turgidum]|uniref:methylenetetrahydrofolate reductase C-terminal domain-containing protein n=1 Tax=Dictyoglomus turgidum TaxID=513050 RepID=UPI003C7395BB